MPESRKYASAEERRGELMLRNPMSSKINAAAFGGDAVKLALLLAIPEALPLGCAECGSPSICIAAKGGSLECVKLLAEASNPESTDHDDSSALLWAAYFGHVDCVVFLLGFCDQEQRNVDGVSAAIAAACSKSKTAAQCLALLLPTAKRSLDPDNSGMNLFDHAICHAESEASVDLLCEYFRRRIPFNVLERHMTAAICKGANANASPDILAFCKTNIAAMAERVAIDEFLAPESLSAISGKIRRI